MPPKKGKAGGASSSSRPSYDHKVFISDQAFEIYLSLTSASFTVERPVLVGERDRWGNYTELKEKIAENIKSRGWENWLEPMEQGSANIVREFYANAKATKSLEDVMVRGKKVSITEENINALFSLPFVRCDYTNFKCKLRKDLDLKAISLALTGAPNNFQDNNIIRGTLTLESKFWLNFIKANTQPVDHASDFHFNRVLFLYAIMTGMKINVGRYIHEELENNVVKSKRSLPKLWFPNMISRLLIKQGVARRTDDALVKVPTPLGINTIKRILTEAKKANDKRSREDSEEDDEEEEEGQGVPNPIPPQVNQESYPPNPYPNFDFGLMSQHLNYVSQGLYRLDGVFGLVSSHLNIDTSSFPPLGPPPPPMYYPPPRPPSNPGDGDMEE